MPSAGHAQALADEVDALRTQVAELKAREAEANARLKALEDKLATLELQPITLDEAVTVRGRFIAPAANPMTMNPALDQFNQGARSIAAQSSSGFAAFQEQAADLQSDELPVQKAPDPTEAVQDIVQQQQGVQRSRFGAELSLGYSHFGDARINLDGFLALDAIFLGTISIDEVDADIFTSDLTLRYGVSDKFFIDASIPFLYRTSNFRSGGAGGAANVPIETRVSDQGLGDVSIGASYQIMAETARRPNLVVSGRVKLPTGQQPFGIDFVEVEGSEGNLQVPRSLATGSGVWGASFGVSALKTMDPMVVFGSINYFRNFERGFADIDENPGDQPGRVSIGNALQFGAGLAYALNETSSISMSYSQRLVERSRLKLDTADDFQRVVGSQANIGLVNLGATFSLARNLSLINTVGIGLTDDSPDMVVSVRVPYRF
ncbi:MAG: transporter [Rhodospirillales bacterium]|nr:transporter [Rhodospirillales bacterium]